MKLFSSLQTALQEPVYDPNYTFHPAPVVTVTTEPVALQEYYLADADGYVLTDSDGYVLTFNS